VSRTTGPITQQSQLLSAGLPNPQNDRRGSGSTASSTSTGFTPVSTATTSTTDLFATFPGFSLESPGVPVRRTGSSISPTGDSQPTSLPRTRTHSTSSERRPHIPPRTTSANPQPYMNPACPNEPHRATRYPSSVSNDQTPVAQRPGTPKVSCQYFCTDPACDVKRSEGFPKKDGWTNHELVAHEHLEEYCCNQCPKTYKLKKKFSEHHKGAHGCSKDCSRTTQHHEKHHKCGNCLHANECLKKNLPRKGAWGCGYCGETLVDWAQRVDHIGRHYSEGHVTKNNWSPWMMMLGLLRQPYVEPEWTALTEGLSLFEIHWRHMPGAEFQKLKRDLEFASFERADAQDLAWTAYMWSSCYPVQLSAGDPLPAGVADGGIQTQPELHHGFPLYPQVGMPTSGYGAYTVPNDNGRAAEPGTSNPSSLRRKRPHYDLRGPRPDSQVTITTASQQLNVSTESFGSNAITMASQQPNVSTESFGSSTGNDRIPFGAPSNIYSDLRFSWTRGDDFGSSVESLGDSFQSGSLP
jgi:hypothetical protein